MLSIFLLIPLSLMLFVVAIWAVRYAVKSNQFEDLDNASQLIILEDRQERRQVIQAHEQPDSTQQAHAASPTHAAQNRTAEDKQPDSLTAAEVSATDTDEHPKP
jgi:cbb3-type cytochrome oxidase maturation protein